MGLFGFGKKNDVVDLAERYRKQKEMQNAADVDSVDAVVAGTGVTGQKTPSSGEMFKLGDSTEEKRRKLAKRILDMTSRLEDLSNKVFLLGQRVELLEKKMNVSST